MADSIYIPVTGAIRRIAPLSGQCCRLMITLRTEGSPAGADRPTPLPFQTDTDMPGIPAPIPFTEPDIPAPMPFAGPEFTDGPGPNGESSFPAGPMTAPASENGQQTPMPYLPDGQVPYPVEGGMYGPSSQTADDAPAAPAPQQPAAPFLFGQRPPVIPPAVSNQEVNLILTPETYVANNITLRNGMRITGFYDANLPVPLIYPPQYQAAFIAPVSQGENVTVAYFDQRLLALDRSLQLRLGTFTNVTTANGQRYTCSVGNHLLMVFYGVTTRSLPPQTTPHRIIVFCTD